MRPAASPPAPSLISIFQNTTVLSKVVAATLLLGYLIPLTGVLPSTLGYLALVPGRCGSHSKLKLLLCREARDGYALPCSHHSQPPRSYQARWPFSLRTLPWAWNLFTYALVTPNLVEVRGTKTARQVRSCFNLRHPTTVLISGICGVFFQLLTSLLGWLILCKVVEPVYGTKGLVLFIVFDALATGFLTFVTVFIIYVATRSAPLL